MDTTGMLSTTREESEWVQESGAQHFHEPHPEFWQPIQEIGRSSREQDCRRDGVGWVLHRRACRNTSNYLGFAQGSISQVFIPLGRGASVSGPVRSMSENLAYDTSDQPLDLQVLKRTAETGRGGNGCRRFGHWRLFRKAWGTSCLSS